MLYGDKRPRRVSLPTYPFARERYWIADKMKDVSKDKLSLIISKDELAMVEDAIIDNENSIEDNLKRIISFLLGISREKIDTERDIREYGFNSLVGMKLLNRLRDIYRKDISVRKFLENNTIKDMAKSLIDEKIVTGEAVYGKQKREIAKESNSSINKRDDNGEQRGNKITYDRKLLKSILRDLKEGRITPSQAKKLSSKQVITAGM